MNTVTGAHEAGLDSLFTQGGPGAAVMRRFRLHNPELDVASTRAALAMAIVSWLPLLCFAAAQGLLLGNTRIPFFKDLAAQTRFLLAVPTLVLADIPIGFRLREMVRHFLNSGLIGDDERARFGAILIDVMRLRDSRVAGIAVIVLAYIATYLNFTSGQLQRGSTWYTPEAAHLSLAGYWYVLVSLPIFQFLLVRWVYRMFTWSMFLLKVSRLDLKLTAAHPDAAGGLGFLGKSLIPFGAITFALSTVISGAIASRVIFAGADLRSYVLVYVVFLLIMLLVFAGPLLIFTPRLIHLKYQGMLKYGVLAGRYVQLFERRWIELGESRQADESVLGTGDIQSLADMGNSFELVRKMRVLPVELSDFVSLSVPALIPALPLVAMVMPLGDIAKDLLKLVA